LKYVEVVVGNSSSGLLEVPSFGIPTVNIGDRQKGRLKAVSIIDCEPKKSQITDEIKRAISSEFKEVCKHIKNPYGDGGASELIIRKIEDTDLQNIVKKGFYDINFG
jgi:GDP/UDP-N,N'-diacetylbacillosamine 2-epimerase (hydrolysing)